MGPRNPTAADVHELCKSIAGLGLAPGLCRINPDYEIGVLSDRILAR